MLTDVVTGMVAANKLNMAKKDENDNEE